MKKIIYRYCYSVVGVAYSRVPIKFDKTKEIGFFNFDFDFEEEYPKLISDVFDRNNSYYSEKTSVLFKLYQKYGDKLKYDYTITLRISKAYEGSKNIISEVSCVRLKDSL